MMEDLKETIRLRCAFCRSEQFALPYEDYSLNRPGFVGEFLVREFRLP